VPLLQKSYFNSSIVKYGVKASPGIHLTSYL